MYEKMKKTGSVTNTSAILPNPVEFTFKNIQGVIFCKEALQHFLHHPNYHIVISNVMLHMNSECSEYVLIVVK
jgi:hypothetical protein